MRKSMACAFGRLGLMLAVLSFSVSVSVSAQDTQRSRAKVQTFVGHLQLLESRLGNHPEFYLQKTRTLRYKLSVPNHIHGVARLLRNRKVTVKAIMQVKASSEPQKTGLLKVKNIARYRPQR